MTNSKNNFVEKTWSCIIEDADDGSGDGILTLPPELCEMKGWKEGTVLNMKVENGVLYISEVPSEKNNIT
jgi:hypothetical protein